MANTDIGGYNINYSPTSHNGSRMVDLTIIGKSGKFMR
jgi:hypothetical protein